MQLIFIVDNNVNNLVTYFMDIKKLKRVDIEKIDRIYFGSERRPRRCIRVDINIYEGNPIEIPGYFNIIKDVEFNLLKQPSGEMQWLDVSIGDVIEILRTGHKNRLCKIVQLEPDVQVVEISYYGVRIVKHKETDESFKRDSKRIYEEYEQKLKTLS